MSIETIFAITLMLATLFTTTVMGLLFAFAMITMPGIKGLNNREFIRAFQGMDGIIQNNHPLFMVVWVGSALFLLMAVVLGSRELDNGEHGILIAATIIYFLGVQLPTGTINVPLNNQLQKVNVDALSEKALSIARNEFESRWNQWNGIRTIFAILTSTLLVYLLFIL